MKDFNKKSFLFLTFFLFSWPTAHAQENGTSWLEGNIIRKAVAANELSLTHIGHSVTELKTALTYKNTSKQYGSTIYRVKLDYKLTWGSGYGIRSDDYLVLLRTSGQTEIYSDDIFFLKDFATKVFPDFESRKDFVLNSYSDGMMSATFGQYIEMAQSKAESYVSKTRPSAVVIPYQTLVIGLGSQRPLGRNLMYRFEIATQTNEEYPKINRQYVIVIVSSASSTADIFEEDAKYSN